MAKRFGRNQRRKLMAEVARFIGREIAHYLTVNSNAPAR